MLVKEDPSWQKYFVRKFEGQVHMHISHYILHASKTSIYLLTHFLYLGPLY